MGACSARTTAYPHATYASASSPAPRAEVRVLATLVSGASVDCLGSQIFGDDPVRRVREGAAAALGVHAEQLQLVSVSGRELFDEEPVGEACEGTWGELAVTVVRKPCRARPADYGSHVVRYLEKENEAIRSFRAYVTICTKLIFPPTTGININMMPFVMGQKSSVPEEYHQYWDMIMRCGLPRCEEGKIGFLTIQESLVTKGESQRRGGLHVDSSLVMTAGGHFSVEYDSWGGGFDDMEIEGGIYMCSSVPRSCIVWDVQLRKPELIVGHLGDVEHLRDVVGEGMLMDEGELIWLTDTTPHESLPLGETVFRQYFRLVTSSVSVWYEKHSTANRLGVRPDPAITKVLAHDKFSAALHFVAPDAGASGGPSGGPAADEAQRPPKA